MAEPRVFQLIPTHTTRHLAVALASVACHEDLPDGVVLTCDNEEGEILGLAEGVWRRVLRTRPEAPPLLIVQRPTHGRAHLNQVRNNGVRALDEAYGLRDEDLVLLVDGDTALHPASIARHRADTGDLIIPYRVELPEGDDGGLDADALASGTFPDLAGLLTPERSASLEQRHRRYERQLRTKRIPLWGKTVKAHKPKLIGGHHAIRVSALREVNGFDEEFIGYRFNDDDLAKRLHMLGVRASIRVRDIHAFHLWHPVRAPAKLHEAPGYERFMRPVSSPRSERGWQDPLPQGTVVVTRVGAEPAG